GLKKEIATLYEHQPTSGHADFISVEKLTGSWIAEIQELCHLRSSYSALHVACNYLELSYLQAAQKIQVAALADLNGFHKSKVQAEEIMQRYQRIGTIMQQCVIEESPLKKTIISERIDKFLLHPLWGNVTLL